MSLENLVRSKQLLPQAADPEEFARRLDAARRSLADAARKALAPESRFDLAYKTVLQCAVAALRLRGYRLASGSGHHATAIQSLMLTIGYEKGRVLALDQMRRKRNAVDYEADVVSDTMVEECVAEARHLLETIEQIA